jgi:hypothetical protein
MFQGFYKADQLKYHGSNRDSITLSKSIRPPYLLKV